MGNSMSTVKFDTWQNTDGTENYKCRAWVRFNNVGTATKIDSGNVSSVTDTGTGNARINFMTALPHANYAIAGTTSNITEGTSIPSVGIDQTNVPTTTTLDVMIYVGSQTDTYGSITSVSVFL